MAGVRLGLGEQAAVEGLNQTYCRVRLISAFVHSLNKRVLRKMEK